MRRIALRVLLGSIAVSCLLGVYAVLAGRFGTFEEKVLATSLTLSIGSVLAMASFAAWELPIARVPSRAGVIGSIAGCLLVIIGFWTEPRNDFAWQLAGSVCLIGIAGAHVSLLMLARLAPAQQWVRTAVIAIEVMLVSALLAVIWEIVRDSDGLFQGLAALAIIGTGLSLTALVFHLVNRVAPPPGAVVEVCFCPRCGKRLWHPAGEVRCHHCDQAFFIELRDASELPSAIARET
jgi:hypothetical protein